jgi:hypothetical protein
MHPAPQPSQSPVAKFVINPVGHDATQVGPRFKLSPLVPSQLVHTLGPVPQLLQGDSHL